MKTLHRIFGLLFPVCLGSLALQARISGELRGKVSDPAVAGISKAAGFFHFDSPPGKTWLKKDTNRIKDERFL